MLLSSSCVFTHPSKNICVQLRNKLKGAEVIDQRSAHEFRACVHPSSSVRWSPHDRMFHYIYIVVFTNTVNTQKTHENCHSGSRWLLSFQQISYVCDDTPTSVEQGARCHHSSTIQLLLCVALAGDTSVPVVTVEAHSVTLLSWVFSGAEGRQVVPYWHLSYSLLCIQNVGSGAGLTFLTPTLLQLSPQIWSPWMFGRKIWRCGFHRDVGETWARRCCLCACRGIKEK